VKMFDAHKTGMIGLPYGGKNDMLSSFHTVPACHGRTDRQTDRITISISRVSSAIKMLLVKAILSIYSQKFTNIFDKFISNKNAFKK